MDLDGVAGGDYYKLCDLDATFNGAEWDLDDDIFGCPTPGSASLCGQCGGASPGYGWCDGQCKGGPDSDVIDLVALPRNGATTYYSQRSTDSCVDSPPPAAAGDYEAGARKVCKRAGGSWQTGRDTCALGEQSCTNLSEKLVSIRDCSTTLSGQAVWSSAVGWWCSQQDLVSSTYRLCDVD